MCKFIRFFTAAYFLFVCFTIQAEPVPKSQEKVVYWYRNFDRQASYDILSLALDKTKDVYGDAHILRSDKLTQGRAIANLGVGNKDSIRLISVVADDTRSSKIVPIKIALDEGLIGLKVCIINRKQQDLFVGLRSHQDISDNGIVFGQGQHWTDTKILKANALEVVTSAPYENLYPMLKSKRFNCFLRGVSEVIPEMERYDDESLMIEPNILFAYPSSSLFYVNEKDIDLAARIELGLRRAILDGSYSQYFKETFFEDIKQLRIGERRVIRLNNPLLTTETIKSTSEGLSLTDGKIDIY